MAIVWLAALGATIVTAILTGLWFAATRGRALGPRAVTSWALRLWVFTLVLDLGILYVAMPALTGPYWGWQWLLWPLLLTGIFALFDANVTRVRRAGSAFSRWINSGAGGHGVMRTRSWRSIIGDTNGDARLSRLGSAPAAIVAGGAAILLALLLATVGNGLLALATARAGGNAKALATITTEPAGTPIPLPDATHMVLVTQLVAANRGQLLLAGTSKNPRWDFHTDQNDFALQAVNGHLYWIAPLVYNNPWANLGNWESPGYVVVDAEDPAAEPRLKTGYRLRYLPDAVLNRELLRHVYLSGYTGEDLAAPTFVVDDSWTPYYTVALTQPAGGPAGNLVSEVLLVDPRSGAITEYAPNRAPAWVDRTIPVSAVTGALASWGRSASSQQALAPGTPELVYMQGDQPVWFVPVTASAGGTAPLAGVVFFDTREMTGRYYPTSGLATAGQARMAFQSSAANSERDQVNSVRLYLIDGRPAWVATYVRKDTYGQSFQAVGVVNARALDGANVIVAPNKAEALARYAEWLARHPA